MGRGDERREAAAATCDTLRSVRRSSIGWSGAGRGRRSSPRAARRTARRPACRTRRCRPCWKSWLWSNSMRALDVARQLLPGSVQHADLDVRASPVRELDQVSAGRARRPPAAGSAGWCRIALTCRSSRRPVERPPTIARRQARGEPRRARRGEGPPADWSRRQTASAGPRRGSPPGSARGGRARPATARRARTASDPAWLMPQMASTSAAPGLIADRRCADRMADRVNCLSVGILATIRSEVGQFFQLQPRPQPGDGVVRARAGRGFP